MGVLVLPVHRKLGARLKLLFADIANVSVHQLTPLESLKGCRFIADRNADGLLPAHTIGMVDGLEVARGFIHAVQEKDANGAAALCAEDVEVLLPGADEPLRGKEGVRTMIRMAPDFLQSMRDEQVTPSEVRITTLTRAPGLFANYTTWRFVTDDGHVKRLSFELKGAN